MKSTKIVGKVKTGSGKASLIREDVYKERCKAAGVPLKRGTLNIKVENLNYAVSALGDAHFESDSENKENKKLGPLRWWEARITGKKFPSEGVHAFVVRHYRTKTNYLEVMSDVHFCNEFGLKDNDVVYVDVIKKQFS